MVGQKPDARMDNPDVQAVVEGNSAFALDLYRELKGVEGNLFFSPYSISTALAMTYAGAREDTEMQMARALHFPLDQKRLHPVFALLEAELNGVREKGNVQLNVANALWSHEGYPFLREFVALMKKHYGVLITPVDYGDAETARGKINAWVEGKTAHKIKDLIGPGILNALTRLVLVNAIYFKGDWANQFDATRTQHAPFWVTPADELQTPMMTQKQNLRYAESDGLQILELPYVGSDLSMIVLLPGEIDGLAELENGLTVENLEKWTSLPWERQVVVFLPRFRASSQFRLKDTLMQMGMTDAFDGGKANFSGMDGREGWLYIMAVIHQAFVDVNEQGSEAAAATAVVMGIRSIPPPPSIFRADHPFIFLIRDNRTGSILFLGRVVNPIA